jgi:hypothetical protein
MFATMERNRKVGRIISRHRRASQATSSKSPNIYIYIHRSTKNENTHLKITKLYLHTNTTQKSSIMYYFIHTTFLRSFVQFDQNYLSINAAKILRLSDTNRQTALCLSSSTHTNNSVQTNTHNFTLFQALFATFTFSLSLHSRQYRSRVTFFPSPLVSPFSSLKYTVTFPLKSVDMYINLFKQNWTFRKEHKQTNDSQRSVWNTSQPSKKESVKTIESH